MTKDTRQNQKQLKDLSGNQSGFTLADVAIASAIFSGVLLVCLSAFIAMGRIYFKGSIETRTQGVARKVLDEIDRTISTTAVAYKLIDHGPDWKAYCIAGIKYSFREGYQLDRDPPGGSTKRVNQVFVKSIVTDSMGQRTESCDNANPEPPDSGGIELLGQQMRITEFSIVENQRLHSIKLSLVYGGDPDEPARENEVFEFPREINMDPFDENDQTHLEFTDETRCELAETFCFITRNRRDVYQSVSE